MTCEKKVQAGDVVTLRGTVKTVGNTKQYGQQNVLVTIPRAHGLNVDAWYAVEDLASIEPRPLQVGDKVRGAHWGRDWHGEIKAICDGEAWVKSRTTGGTSECQTIYKLADLERIND